MFFMMFRGIEERCVRPPAIAVPASPNIMKNMTFGDVAAERGAPPGELLLALALQLAEQRVPVAVLAAAFERRAGVELRAASVDLGHDL